MKKILRFIVFAGMFIILSGWLVGQAKTATTLSDISGHWAYIQINNLLNRGAINGYGDRTFRPDNSISRAEFITIVNNAFEFKYEASICYTDVFSDDWYYPEVACAEAAGYLPNYPDGKMVPNQPITREEAAFIMAGVLHLDTAYDGSFLFDDSSSISSCNVNAVANVVKNGYMTGYPDGKFRPLDNISRAETATIICKGLQLNWTPMIDCNVYDYGAKGDGVTDDTVAINKAINYVYSMGGGTVFISDGIYLVNPDISIMLKNNVKLNLLDNATLKAKPTSSESYEVIIMDNVTNASVVGGSIIGERYEHIGTTGESGMGIGVYDSNNITISDISISDCWGDGIYLGSDSIFGYDNNVDVERFICNNNRRHGVCVISAKNLTIKDGVCSYSNGASPQSGLDLEPNYTSQILQNISIENLKTVNNGGYGVDFWLGNDTIDVPVNNISIIIKNHIDTGSVKGTLHDIAYYIRYGYDITVE